jgi:hypothetical protein
MTTEDYLRALINQGESATIDFKAEPHRLDNDHFNSEFIKDILSMANTPREGSAFIIIGVKLHANGNRDYLGVTSHTDDSDLQDKLKLARVEPKPEFTYQPMMLDGKSYGIIEIPLKRDGPYYTTRDLGVLKAHRLYFRRGTKNDEASVHEQNEIYKWFHQEHTEEKLSAPQGKTFNAGSWDEFVTACHKFDSGRLYLFVVGPTTGLAHESWQLLGRLPLSLVLDFDPATETQGVFHVASIELRNNRSVHLITLEDQYTLVPERACYWFASRGLLGRSRTLVTGEWREWNRKYSSAIQELVKGLAKASGGRPLTVVSLWYAPEYLRQICTIVDSTFGDYADYVFAVSDSSGLKDLAGQFGGQAISINIESVLHGIVQSIPSSPASVLQYGVPHSDGSFRLISTPDLKWLSEDLEVLHSNIEIEAVGSDREPGKEFLRGAVVSWPDLSAHLDAERDITDRLVEQVERELGARTAVRFNLYHWPGAGGTTIARRVAWILRRRYPTVLLKRVTAGETVGRLRKIFQLTSQPILAVVEGADAIPDKIEQLYTEVRAEQIPVVFLFVLRRSDRPNDGDRTAFLGQSLTIPESFRFTEVYKRIAPNRVTQLQEILNKPDLKDRTPFQFALAAFGREYLGLSRYIEARLEKSTTAQKEILTFLSLAYYYGHKAILPQLFAAHLQLPESKPVRLEKLLNELQLELLVRDDGGKWRPAHQLIAEEMLQTVLSGTARERRNWKGNLSAWSLAFIAAVCKSTRPATEDLVELIRRVFILRDEHDLLGTEGAGTSSFAQVIEDIQTPEGQVSVLKELVAAFPGEAHFWGHLGRFYSIIMEEPNEALVAINRAIELSPGDSVLHHMKGMCYRKIAYSQMRNRDDGFNESEFRETVERAKNAFADARVLDPDSEHAHISPVQLLLRVLDFGYRHSGYESRAEFLVTREATWHREQLDEAESLLEQVRGLREGEKPSRFFLGCQADLFQVYDNYSRALEGWNSLLSRPDVFAPPIRRQIARAYLSRKRRQWTNLPQKEIDRIIELMEANMREEPSSSHNIRMWFRAVRLSSQQDIDVVLDRLANWRSTGDTPEAYYYLYVLHVLKAMDGSMIERVRSDELIQESQAKARSLRNRTKSFEWYGIGTGLGRLKHYSELGEWNDYSDFYSNTEVLERVDGRIVEIKAPEKGVLEITSCSLKAFFVPAKGNFYKGKDENTRVSFYLGFSYDGLRAWDVAEI